MAVERPLPFQPGDVLGGKYRVSRVIGEGGMGIVVEATHVQLDERVAVKFLRPDMMAMKDVVARFDREARAAVKLKSEHVARVMDVGHTEAGVPYMVMEYLDGKDLGDTLAEGGPLPIAQAVEYIIHACEGIGEAHARGIVHRDVKPENLFLVKREDGWRSVKVLDFGISKTALVGASAVDMASSHTTSIMGSPHYMSPEQLRSTRTVDHRADVWSLGVVLFELLTGVMPFDETLEFTELVAEILEKPHRSAKALRPEVPDALEHVIDRALEKDRARRYQNTAELAVALLPFAPKRARAMVERAASISRAAGLADAGFQLPPSDLPPASAEAMLPLGSIGSPRVPQMDAPTMVPPRGPHSTPSIGGSVETVAPPQQPSRSRGLLIGGSVAGVALLFAIAFVIRSASHDTPVAHTDQTASHPAQPVATTGASIAPTKATRAVRRVLVVEPRDATVTVDGVPLSRATPWIEGSSAVLVHAEAAGHVTRDLTVTFDNDDPLVVQLDPIANNVPSTTKNTTRPLASAAPSAIASASVSAAPPPPPPPTASPTDVGY